MRETALMDVLKDARPAATADQWVPSAEQVLGTAQLASPPGGPRDSGRAGPELGPGGRPSGFGPPRRPGSGSTPGAAPILTPDDLEALADLTFAELAEARGVDPGGVGRLRPSRRPPADDSLSPPPRHPQAAPPRHPQAPPPRHPQAPPAADALPTWPPPGLVPTWSAGHGPRRRRGRRLLGTLILLAGAGVAVAVLAVRPGAAAHPAGWDSRVAPIAAFVAHERGLTWKHPVQVSFLSAQAYADRFGVRSVAAPGGSNVAHYQATDDQVYVKGSPIDLYQLFALAGQLTEALQGQYTGSATTAATYVEATKVQSAYVQSLPASAAAALWSQAVSSGAGPGTG